MAAHGTLAEVRSLAAGVLGHEAAPAFEQRLSENASEAGLRAFVKFLSDMNLWSEAEDSKKALVLWLSRFFGTSAGLEVFKTASGRRARSSDDSAALLECLKTLSLKWKSQSSEELGDLRSIAVQLLAHSKGIGLTAAPVACAELVNKISSHVALERGRVGSLDNAIDAMEYVRRKTALLMRESRRKSRPTETPKSAVPRAWTHEEKRRLNLQLRVIDYARESGRTSFDFENKFRELMALGRVDEDGDVEFDLESCDPNALAAIWDTVQELREIDERNRKAAAATASLDSSKSASDAERILQKLEKALAKEKQETEELDHPDRVADMIQRAENKRLAIQTHGHVTEREKLQIYREIQILMLGTKSSKKLDALKKILIEQAGDSSDATEIEVDLDDMSDGCLAELYQLVVVDKSKKPLNPEQKKFSELWDPELVEAIRRGDLESGSGDSDGSPDGEQGVATSEGSDDAVESDDDDAVESEAEAAIQAEAATRRADAEAATLQTLLEEADRMRVSRLTNTSSKGDGSSDRIPGGVTAASNAAVAAAAAVAAPRDASDGDVSFVDLTLDSSADDSDESFVDLALDSSADDSDDT